MRRQRVMHLGLDTVRLQMRLQRIALRAANHEQMPGVLLFAHHGRQADLRVPDTVAIAARHAAAPGDVVVEILQLHPQQRGLHFVESRVASLEQVAILYVGAVVAQRRDPLRQRAVVGHHRAAVAQRAKILGGEKTEGRRVAERTRLAADAHRTMRLCRVFDQQQFVPRRQRRQRRHVRQLAIQVHRHDRACARSDRRLDAGRIQVETCGVGFHRHRHQPVLANRQKAGDEGIAGQDDLVAFFDRAEFLVAAQDQRQRIQPIAHAHRVAHAAIGGELVFERRQFLAQHVPARIDDARGRGLQRIGVARVDLLEAEEGNVHQAGLHHSDHS